jgi:hypothetical protein
MSLETCTLSPSDYTQLIADQVSSIRDNIMQDVAYNSPFMNTIRGETVDLNFQGKNIPTLVANRVSPGWSRTAPVFTDSTLGCGASSNPDRYGQTEYTTKVESLFGESDPLCLREHKHVVKNSLSATVESMRTAITELMNVDVRNQYLRRSGVKFVANTTLKFNGFTGQRKAVGTEFAAVLPDTPMTFKALIKIQQYMTEVLGVKKFGSGAGAHFKVIAGVEQIEQFRNEVEVLNGILAQTQGGFAIGDEQIRSYSWTEVQHRGVQMAIDQQPLRFNEIDGDGWPILIAPEIEVDGDHGKDSITNPAWNTALYEVGFIMGDEGFKRLVPTKFVGEGLVNWSAAPQFVMGELEFLNIRDNQCNKRGDFGFFLYEVARAIQSWNPHAICPFTYKRCELDLGFETCPSQSSELIA